MWEKEDTVSIAKNTSITFPKVGYSKGTTCKVKYGKQVLDAKILDISELKCTHFLKSKQCLLDFCHRTCAKYNIYAVVQLHFARRSKEIPTHCRRSGK